MAVWCMRCWSDKCYPSSANRASIAVKQTTQREELGLRHVHAPQGRHFNLNTPFDRATSNHSARIITAQRCRLHFHEKQMNVFSF